VLHVIASLAIGGTERQLVEFINRSSRPQNHHVALFDELGSLAGLVPNPPIVVGQMRRDLRSAPANLRTVGALRRLIRQLGVDLVHAHLDLSAILAVLAAPRGVPIVLGRRGRNVGIAARPWLKPAEALGRRRVSLVLCNAHYLADQTRRRAWWPPPVEVIHNGIDLEAFAAAPMPPAEPPTAVVVANMQPYKGHEDFLRAFRAVADRNPSARAVLVGDGRERWRLEGLTTTLGLEAAVTFAGRVQDPRPFVSGSHLVALTSEHEGFPNALLEAMAMGRPVVATSVGGVPELVRNGVDGFLVANDPAEIADRMLRLLGDPSLLDQMGKAARTRAEAFGWDNVVERTEEAYARVLAQRPRKRTHLVHPG
jgi:glycosyltransferase involved in cell wall biosynthesis